MRATQRSTFSNQRPKTKRRGYPRIATEKLSEPGLDGFNGLKGLDEGTFKKEYAKCNTGTPASYFNFTFLEKGVRGW
jgi:hypothetical protein